MTEQHYAEKGIDAFHGLARFTDPDAVTVEGQEFKARYILIAGGARPVTVRIPGENHVIISDRFLELDALPPHIVLVAAATLPRSPHISRRMPAHA